MWGTGASSTQCEGAGPASDWWDWERAGHAPISGDGNGFATRYAEDFALFASLGLVHHRLSIDWSRIEPEEGRRDDAAIAHYRDVLTAAGDAGVMPWVCLHHFTLPRWFSARGAFAVNHNRVAWTRHVDFIAEEYGDLVGGWQPVNENNIYPTLGYRGLGFPPGHRDFAEWAAVTENIHLATAEAAVRLKQTGRPVSSIFALSTEEPLDRSTATGELIDRLRETNWTIWLDLYRDGVLRVPGRDPVERADLAGSFDIIGFSFYSTLGVREGAIDRFPEEAPISPLGYSIWAPGLDRVLRRLHEELPGAPLLVAEYGVGTDDDDLRADYLRQGLAIVNEAIGRGVDVRGLFHWTGVDNYEWLLGHDVHFGIIDRDRNVRPSAKVLQQEAGGAAPA